MSKSLHVKYLLFLSDFNKTYFLNRYAKKAVISIFMKIRPVRVEICHWDGQTNRHEACCNCLAKTLSAHLYVFLNRHQRNSLTVQPSALWTLMCVHSPWHLPSKQTDEHVPLCKQLASESKPRLRMWVKTFIPPTQ
jgi:hypothetical protein